MPRMSAITEPSMADCGTPVEMKTCCGDALDAFYVNWVIGRCRPECERAVAVDEVRYEAVREGALFFLR